MTKPNVSDEFQYLIGRIHALEGILAATLASYADSSGKSSKFLTALEDLSNGTEQIDPPPLKWSARIVRKRRIRYGNQA